MATFSWDRNRVERACAETLSRYAPGDGVARHRNEAIRLRGKADACHDAAGGATNSCATYGAMADFHEAVAAALERRIVWNAMQ